MKKTITLILAAILVFSMVLAGCGDSGNADYKVTVVDQLGNPYADVIVRFMQNGTQSAMEVTKEDGVAVKNMPKGDYTVELQFTDSEEVYHYDTEGLSLSADTTELTILLAKGVSDQSRTLYAYSLQSEADKDHEAYFVTEGCTYVTLVPGERNYFLFIPSRAGTYAFTVADGDGTVGYYGSPFFVQKESAVDVVDNVVTLSISDGMIGDGGTAGMVLGVDAVEKADCILTIERVGDPVKTVADEPWTEYVTTHTPEPFKLQLPAGKKLTYVDITKPADTYTVVLGDDGVYHLDTKDGPVIYINLSKDAPYVSLQKVIRGDGPMGGAPIRNYFYDADGNFQKKEDYTAILDSYFDCLDETYGVYPLTQDLAYIIQQGCDGWWDAESPDYILDGCTPELGWLFACCYIG